MTYDISSFIKKNIKIIVISIGFVILCAIGISISRSIQESNRSIKENNEIQSMQYEETIYQNCLARNPHATSRCNIYLFP